jgi:hypothetical protein
MSSAQAPPQMSGFPDRSVRLMVLGGLQIVMGLVLLLSVAMLATIFFGRLPKGPQGEAMSGKPMLPALVIDVPIAAGFLCLGAGLIRARRWAWTLTVVLSWMGLLLGLFLFTFNQLLMGSKIWEATAGPAELPPGTATTIHVISTLSMACIYILLPLFFGVLCHSKSVRATCYRIDPQSSWVDRCPMPVLALSLLLAFSAVSTLSAMAQNFVMPMFGVFLSGLAGAAAVVLIAQALVILAFGTYRLRMTAWWGTLLIGIAASLNWAVVAWRSDLMQMYEKIGASAAEIDLFRKMGLAETTSRWGPWMALAGGVAWVCYLLFVRRYFVRRGATTVDPMSVAG